MMLDVYDRNQGSEGRASGHPRIFTVFTYENTHFSRLFYGKRTYRYLE